MPPASAAPCPARFHTYRRRPEGLIPRRSAAPLSVTRMSQGRPPACPSEAPAGDQRRCSEVLERRADRLEHGDLGRILTAHDLATAEAEQVADDRLVRQRATPQRLHDVAGL